MDRVGQGNCGWPSCSFCLCLSQDTCLWVSLDDCGMKSINLAFALAMEIKIGLFKVNVKIMGTGSAKSLLNQVENSQNNLNVIVCITCITLSLGLKKNSSDFRALLMVFWLISARQQSKKLESQTDQDGSSGFEKKDLLLVSHSLLTRACNSGQVVRVQIAQMLSIARGVMD